MSIYHRTLRLGILLSGGGRTMVNLARCIQQDQLNAEITTVISSRSHIAGVQRAREIGIEPHIVQKQDFDDIEKFSLRLAILLHEGKVDLVCQCGWLCLWKIPDDFRNRVMNIHPSLLPAFGGRGMWGHHVHQAVLDAGCKVSGCTVHFVTDEYDAGPIIIQRTCPVLEGDNADTLAERVFEQECRAYPQAIRLYGQARLHVENNIVHVSPHQADTKGPLTGPCPGDDTR